MDAGLLSWWSAYRKVYLGMFIRISVFRSYFKRCLGVHVNRSKALFEEHNITQDKNCCRQKYFIEPNYRCSTNETHSNLLSKVNWKRHRMSALKTNSFASNVQYWLVRSKFASGLFPCCLCVMVHSADCKTVAFFLLKLAGGGSDQQKCGHLRGAGNKRPGCPSPTRHITCGLTRTPNQRYSGLLSHFDY